VAIDPNPPEVSGFPKRSEYPLEGNDRRDVDVALGAVVEPEAQSVYLEDLDALDIVEHGHRSGGWSGHRTISDLLARIHGAVRAESGCSEEATSWSILASGPSGAPVSDILREDR